MRGVFLFFLFCSFMAASFPKLTAHVVDEASLLSPAISKEIEKVLKDEEQRSTNQIVVVTVNSLNDMDISKYAVELGRHWQIGQKGKDNGVLLIIAPKQRRVNITVGYGLEGILTDAISSEIIYEKIIPKIKNGDYQGGILQGVYGIVEALNSEYNSIEIIREIVGGEIDILESSYPIKTGINLASYHPQNLFSVLFFVSFLLLMASMAIKNKLIQLLIGSIALYSFCIMILALFVQDIISGKLNFILLSLMVVFVVIFTYKNRKYALNR